MARRAALTASKPVIADATSRLNASVSELQEVHRLVSDASRLAQQGIQALSPAERSALATEAEGVLDRLKNVANTKFGQHYLFGGTRSGDQPFQFSEPSVAGRLSVTSYGGGLTNSQSVISPELAVDSLYNGNLIFDEAGRQPTILHSKTGITTSTGTDTMTGRAKLQVRHVLTQYATGSGVVAAANSPGNDTILGKLAAHKLTIKDTSGTGAFGTVSLNNGNEIAFDSSMSSLEVTGPGGEKVFIDTSGITAGFTGDVNITADGTLSVDGGKTTTAIDFTASQTITDSLSGKTVRLNTLALGRTGDDWLEFPGTTDVFETLDSLIRDLRGDRPIDSGALNASLGRTLSRLEQLGDRVLETIGIQSSSLAGLEQVQYRNEDLLFELEAEQSGLQSTDLARAIIDLQSEQLMQQYTYAVTSRIMSQSLLNFLS